MAMPRLACQMTAHLAFSERDSTNEHYQRFISRVEIPGQDTSARQSSLCRQIWRLEQIASTAQT